MGMHHESPTLDTGQSIGGCRVIRLLGRGGMGEVYLAEHLSLQKPVAVKVLPPEMVSERHVERFLKEARMCSRIEHPNVVVIHDVGDQQGMYYIVMQYIQGQNLSELLASQGGPLPWRSALRIVQLAARGLHAVHAQGLVHRDIKPSNIMLAVDSRVILMDFGLVRKELDSSLTRAGQVLGTPTFMSPEQCRGKPLDRRSDVFSLGSTLYCLLAGRPPFQGGLQEVIVQIASGERPTPIERVNQKVSPQLGQLVARAMAPRPEDRFATAASMAGALKKALKSSQLADTATFQTADLATDALNAQPVAAPSEVELLPLKTGREPLQARMAWIAGGAGVACLLVLGLVLNYFFGGADPPAKPPPGPPPSVPANMVYIEEGFARIGNDRDKLRVFLASYFRDEKLEQVLESLAERPQRRKKVPAFAIDRYEVTNVEYAKFVIETGHDPPKHWDGDQPPAEKALPPVVNVSYEDAEAYARWAGRELPTREQWMRAYRGDRDWLFPWGDDYEAGRANVKDNPKYPSTSPVRDTPRDVSPFKAYNLAGNVSEFIRGSYTHEDRICRVGKGAEFGTFGFLRGIAPGQLRYSIDYSGDKGLGFRCVKEDLGTDTP